MSLLDYVDRIPDKIFPKLKPRMVNGFLVFPGVFYREIFHLIASFLLIIVSYLLFLYGHLNEPIIVFIILGAWITYQEFYLHPKKYHQKLWKDMLDWSAWMIPFIIYLIFLYRL